MVLLCLQCPQTSETPLLGPQEFPLPPTSHPLFSLKQSHHPCSRGGGMGIGAGGRGNELGEEKGQDLTWQSRLAWDHTCIFTHVRWTRRAPPEGPW